MSGRGGEEEGDVGKVEIFEKCTIDPFHVMSKQNFKVMT